MDSAATSPQEDISMHPDTGTYEPQSEPIDVPEDAFNEDADAAEVQHEEGKKRSRKEKSQYNLERTPGKTHLPLARVRHILKADRELVTVQKEALFTLTIAAEEFNKRIAGATELVAKRDQRATTQLRDVSALVGRANEFAFLDELIAWFVSETQAERKQKALPQRQKTQKAAEHAQGPLDKFVNKESDSQEADLATGNIIMNEDGTMSIDH